MTVQYIRKPEGLGEPLGKYSHVAVGSGRFVAIAGQVGVDADGRRAGDDIAGQTRQIFQNLERALAAAGATFSDVIKFTTYIVGAERISDYMDARTTIFPGIYPSGEYPPNTLLVVSRLVQPELLIEIEAFAVVA